MIGDQVGLTRRCAREGPMKMCARRGTVYLAEFIALLFGEFTHSPNAIVHMEFQNLSYQISSYKCQRMEL